MPWFILSALVLARNGWRVFMHGAEAHTEGRVYTGAALGALDIPVAGSLDEAADALAARNFAYLPIDALSPKVAEMLELRPILGLRSPVHTFARMLNPFGAPCMLQGVFHPGYMAIHRGAGVLLGQPRLSVFRGEGGEIERRPGKPCDVMMAFDGRARGRALAADDRRAAPGAGRNDGPRPAGALWRGEIEDEYGEAAVVGTLAIALRTLGEAADAADAERRARTLWAGATAAASRRRRDAVTRLFLSATHKSSGKTTLSIGLAAAFRAEGLTVQTFKKGPDYIDPMWLARASGRPCYNLDFNTQSGAEIMATFGRNALGADISVIEGNKGLHDGVDVEGADSSAALAKLLGAPIVLVVDASGMARGVAPLVQGYAAFDREARIAGIILNKVGSERQAGKLRQALDRYTNIPVLGAVGRDHGVVVRERHLGLTTPGETAECDAIVESARRAVAGGVDLARVREVAAGAAMLPAPIAALERSGKGDVRIAVARDEAFGFYYQDDLEAFERAGARLVFFDALRDRRLPDCDGLFIGGGFPETHAARLAANAAMRESIRAGHRERPARLTPNAAGSCTSAARSPGAKRAGRWSAQSRPTRGCMPVRRDAASSSSRRPEKRRGAPGRGRFPRTNSIMRRSRTSLRAPNSAIACGAVRGSTGAATAL